MADISIANPANGATVSKYLFTASGGVISAANMVVTCEIIPSGQQNPVATCTPCPTFVDLNTGSLTWMAVFINLDAMQDATLKVTRVAPGVVDAFDSATINIADILPSP